MKVIILVFSVFLGLSTSYTLENIDINTKLEEINKKYNRLETDGVVTAVLNEFADKIFSNIGPFAILHGLDPIPLNDIKENFLVAEIDLTVGQIHGVSTVNRYKDVKAMYDSSKRSLLLDIPIVFSNLSFTYDYGVKIVLISVSGGLTGVIDDFKIDLQLGFDFNNLTASIRNLKTTDTGKISVDFSGHGITDQIINILTQFVSDVLHPLLTLVIEGIVRLVGNNIVDSVNDVIDNILHPNNTFLTRH